MSVDEKNTHNIYPQISAREYVRSNSPSYLKVQNDGPY